MKRRKQEKQNISHKKKWFDILFYSLSIIVIAVLLFISLRQRGLLPLWIDNQPSTQIAKISDEVRNRRVNFNIINAHEHVQNEENVPILRKAMEDCQVKKMVLLGTSDFTFYLNPDYGFTGYEKNNEFIIKMSKEEKLKQYITEGATGVKLYNGHKTFYDLFFNLPLTDPGMMEVYAYCELENIPILYHINIGLFSKELEHILQEFPRLVIIVPHFMLSSGNLSRLVYFMKEYPQLYTDISFGHPDFLVAGFSRISNNVSAFRDFFVNYRDRITYGTDLVVTSYRAKNRAYIDDVHLAYMDLLEKDEFTLPLSIYKMMSKEARKNIDSNRIFRGLNLDEETLHFIYHDNAERLFFKRNDLLN